MRGSFGFAGAEHKEGKHRFAKKKKKKRVGGKGSERKCAPEKISLWWVTLCLRVPERVCVSTVLVTFTGLRSALRAALEPDAER